MWKLLCIHISLLCILEGKHTLHLSLSSVPIVSESFGCWLRVTLAADYTAYSLSSKDEWFHYSRGEKTSGDD